MAAGALPGRTPVLVIGAGPVGLLTSLLLSERGISHLVVERREAAQRAPAAHVIRRRPMEIFDEVGVGDAIRGAVPGLPLDFITWCTTLGGPEVGRLDLRPLDPETGERSPEPWTNCPQNLLEPILMRAAEERAQATLVRGAECCEITQTADTAVARIRTNGETVQRVEADWVIAADGAGSPTRRKLDIPMEGPGPLARFAMVHLEADLTPWIRERSGPIFWILNPESPGALIVHDPQRSHVFMTPLPEAEDERERIPERLAAALAVPVAPKILSIDDWSPHVQVAERYREGRVLLVGDAAHRFPPSGGLGLNTGIQEAHALVALLAPVVAGNDPAERLDGYEASCRPAARANADESFGNLVRLGEITRVIGSCPDLASLERRIASLTPAEQIELEKAVEAQRSHFLSDGVQPQAA
jgi:2-polyprenyl-6-methoxyphenol hydroxylase-like FAD-dependent oxidoreductase